MVGRVIHNALIYTGELRIVRPTLIGNLKLVTERHVMKLGYPWKGVTHVSILETVCSFNYPKYPSLDFGSPVGAKGQAGYCLLLVVAGYRDRNAARCCAL